MRSVIVFACMIAPFFAAAQQDGEVSTIPQGNGNGREAFVRNYPDHFFIWPVLKQRKFDFEMRSTIGEKKTVGFKSNKPYSFGVGMYLFELGIELAFAVPLDENSKRIYGESKARDLQLNVLGKKWGADLFYQRYSGFYLDDSAVPVPANTPYPQRSDIASRNIGITVNRIFNSNRFSFRSAYNFAERQLTSAGSLIVFATFDNLVTAADSAILGSGYATGFGEAASRIDHIRTSNLGLAPGYTYSLVLKGFFINGTLAIGPVHNWMKYSTDEGGEESRFRFSALVVARLALGYNGDRFFGGLLFMNQGRNVKFADVQLTSTQSAFKILVGMRFRESGVLTKRAMDIPRNIFN